MLLRMRTLAHSGVQRRVAAARRRFRDDDLRTMAGALTFQAFLSLFPLMLLALSIAGFLLAGDPAEWLRRFFAAVPGIGPILDQNLESIVRARGDLGALALIGVVWTSSSLTDQASNALESIFRIQDPHALRRRARSLVTMLILGAVLLAALVISGIVASIHVEGWAETPVRILGLVAVSVVEFGFFLASYRVLLPPSGPRLRAHLPGAIFMTVGWGLLKLVGELLVVYVVTTASALYGAIGGVFGLLLFLRVASSTYLLGAELSAIIDEEVIPSSEVGPPVPR
jgi:YihY family inner membrane protein